jgi:type IV pilus assembly protein PilV
MLKPMPCPTCVQRQRGLTLVESLVAIVVAALGVLGIAGVQIRILADTQNSVRREQAIRLIEDLDERLKVNPNSLVLSGRYVSGWGAAPKPGDDCGKSACEREQLADYDLADWKALVKSTLPLGDANVFLAPGDDANDRRLLGVMIRWRQNERVSSTDGDHANYTKPIDAIQSEAGSDIKCNDDASNSGRYTCHLQYITLAARCAPFNVLGGKAARFYCPGS